jgi:glucose-1-phosphate thymidylyltransferase
MKAIILCGGDAKRLYPLTKDFPKPLLEIKGKTILDGILEKLKKTGIEDIIIVSNDRFYSKFKQWSDGKNVRVLKVLEGHKGATQNLWKIIKREKINEDIFVLSGDILFDFSLKECLDFFKKHKKTMIVSYDLKDKNKASRYGVIERERDIVKRFVEKPLKPRSSLISTGFYIFSKDDVHKIGRYMNSGKSIKSPAYLLEYFNQFHDVYVCLVKGKFFDVGTIKDYETARRIWRW